MAKKKSNLTSFFTTSPLKTGAAILVVISVLLNIGTLLFVVLLNHTTHFDYSLMQYTYNKVCQRDYDSIQSGIAAHPGIGVASVEQKLYAASQCFRDSKTGKQLDLNSVQPVK